MTTNGVLYPIRGDSVESPNFISSAVTSQNCSSSADASAASLVLIDPTSKYVAKDDKEGSALSDFDSEYESIEVSLEYESIQVEPVVVKDDKEESALSGQGYLVNLVLNCAEYDLLLEALDWLIIQRKKDLECYQGHIDFLGVFEGDIDVLEVWQGDIGFAKKLKDKIRTSEFIV